MNKSRRGIPVHPNCGGGLKGLLASASPAEPVVAPAHAQQSRLCRGRSCRDRLPMGRKMTARCSPARPSCRRLAPDGNNATTQGGNPPRLKRRRLASGADTC